MNRNGGDENSIIRRPRDTIVGARQDIRRRHAFTRGIEDDGDVDEDERCYQRRRRSLPHIEPDIHALISPFRYAAAVRRLSPAMAAVGLSACGQSSWQD